MSPEDLRRPLRRIVEGDERLAEHLGGATDLEEASARAGARLDAAIGRLVTALSGSYARDGAELVYLRNVAADPATYGETEHEGNLATVEIVALVAATIAADVPLPDVRSVPGTAVEDAQGAATDAAAQWPRQSPSGVRAREPG